MQSVPITKKIVRSRPTNGPWQGVIDTRLHDNRTSTDPP